MIKGRSPRGVTVSYTLMGIAIIIGIILNFIQTFFLSDASEKSLRIIQKLDANIVGYYLGLATFFILCTRVIKKDKSPNKSSEPILKTPGD